MLLISTVNWVIPLYFTAFMKCLLGHPEKAQRNIFGQIPRQALLRELNAYCVLLGELSTEASDGGYHTQVVKPRRVQLVRE